MKKFFLNLFAVIGIISVVTLTSKIFKLYKSEKTVRKYWKSCEKVEVGMTLQEAREIIGDLKYQYWTQDDKSGEIIISDFNGKLTYSLEYPMIFAGSENMRIKFEPIILRVTDKFCGE
jgi:hypothetical protein